MVAAVWEWSAPSGPPTTVRLGHPKERVGDESRSRSRETSPMDADILKVSILGKESIHCGFHLVPYIVHTVLKTLPASTYVLITDTNVARFHLASFEAEFSSRLPQAAPAPRFLHHVIFPGETSKSREGKAEIEDFLLLNKCTRDTVVLALGGGVIGDLVGFVAATLCVSSDGPFAIFC